MQEPWDDIAWGAGSGGEMFASRLEEGTVDAGATQLHVREYKGDPRGITAGGHTAGGLCLHTMWATSLWTPSSCSDPILRSYLLL